MASEAAIIESAITTIEGILDLPVLEQHKRDLINGMLWTVTEARGKYTTRYRSKGALEAPSGTKLQHEHVFPRKQLVDRIMREPYAAREHLSTAIGCVVTVEEHRRLTAIDRTQPGLHGWERYVAAGITVIDTDDPNAPLPAAAPAVIRRPFWLIDGRLREADFFLQQLKSAPTLDVARYSFSAFTASIAAVPDAITRTLAAVPGYWPWWDTTSAALIAHPELAMLRSIRNQIVHEGLNPLGLFRRSHLTTESFITDEHGKHDAVEISTRGMTMVVATVREAYATFWTALDLPATLTATDLEIGGRTLEMVEQELGLAPGTSSTYATTPTERLSWLKEYSRTVIAEIGHRYAG